MQNLGAVGTLISREASGMDVCLHAKTFLSLSLRSPFLLMGSLSQLTADTISFRFQPLDHSDGLCVRYPYQIAL